MLCSCRITDSSVEDVPIPTEEFEFENSISIDSDSEVTESILHEQADISSNIESHVSEETDEFGTPIGWDTTKSRFPLMAMIKEEDIYLYSINGDLDSSNTGMVLFKDNQGTYFDWRGGLCARLHLPELSYFDYDGDGKKELAIILLFTYGTALYQQDLHILKICEDEYGQVIYTEHTLLCTDIGDWFLKDITAKYSDDLKTIKINFDNNSYNINVDYDFWGLLEYVEYGDVIKYKFTEDNEIIVEITIGLKMENSSYQLFYPGAVEAKVKFDGEKINLTDCKFIVN